MLDYISDKIAKWVLKEELQSDLEYELYKYAVHCMIVSLLPIIFVTILSIVINNVIGMTIIVSSFMLIRKYMGGYHAKTPIGCFVLSVLLVVGAIFISKEKIGIYVVIFLAVVCCVFILFTKPIDSPNKRLSNYEKITFKIKSKRIMFFLIMLSIFLAIIECYRYIDILLGIILASMSLIFSKISLLWNGKKQIKIE